VCVIRFQDFRPFYDVWQRCGFSGDCVNGPLNDREIVVSQEIVVATRLAVIGGWSDIRKANREVSGRLSRKVRLRSTKPAGDALRDAMQVVLQLLKQALCTAGLHTCQKHQLGALGRRRRET
jgi:hypothetical protein